MRLHSRESSLLRQSSLHRRLTCFWQLPTHNHCTLETLACSQQWLLTKSNILFCNSFHLFGQTACESWGGEERLMAKFGLATAAVVGGRSFLGRPVTGAANFNLDQKFLLIWSQLLPCRGGRPCPTWTTLTTPPGGSTGFCVLSLFPWSRVFHKANNCNHCSKKQTLDDAYAVPANFLEIDVSFP